MQNPITPDQAAELESLLKNAIKKALREAMEPEFPPGHYADDICWDLCQPISEHTDSCSVWSSDNRHLCDCGAWKKAAFNILQSLKEASDEASKLPHWALELDAALEKGNIK